VKNYIVNQNILLQQAVRDFVPLERFANPVAVTLTFKQTIFTYRYAIQIDEIQAKENVKNFINRLNAAVYGNAVKRFNKKVGCFPVVECDQTHRIHYHLLLDRPDRLDDAAFESAIRGAWLRTLWGNSQIAYEPNANHGWVDYITKLRTKRDYAGSIDWENWAAPACRSLT
jgi:maltooligosyltrehalose synthase